MIMLFIDGGSTLAKPLLGSSVSFPAIFHVFRTLHPILTKQINKGNKSL